MKEGRTDGRKGSMKEVQEVGERRNEVKEVKEGSNEGRK